MMNTRPDETMGNRRVGSNVAALYYPHHRAPPSLPLSLSPSLPLSLSPSLPLSLSLALTPWPPPPLSLPHAPHLRPAPWPGWEERPVRCCAQGYLAYQETPIPLGTR